MTESATGIASSYSFQLKNVELQKRFFESFAKGINNDWNAEPIADIKIHTIGDAVMRVASGAIDQRQIGTPERRPTSSTSGSRSCPR
jgi:hypothetical protein